eukprot:gene24004-9576_t
MTVIRRATRQSHAGAVITHNDRKPPNYPISPIIRVHLDSGKGGSRELSGKAFAAICCGCMRSAGYSNSTMERVESCVSCKGQSKLLLVFTTRIRDVCAHEWGQYIGASRPSPPIDADMAFALHVWPALPAGTIATRPGPIMAGVISFEVTISGQGGHAAMPHLTTNPVVAGASIVSNLKPLMTSALPPHEPVVVNICNISGGDAFNVVPDSITFGGTIRAFSDETMKHLRIRLVEIVESQSSIHGCTGRVNFREDQEPYYPPLVNDARAVKFAVGVAEKVFGEKNVEEAEPTMASEDFAFMAQAVPCCFAFLGVRNEAIGAIHGLHSPLFKVDEDALMLGSNYQKLPVGLFLSTLSACGRVPRASQERNGSE